MQAAGQLRLKIENGDWLPGSQIPVIEHLQQEFGLSRATIRQALDLLEDEGLIARHRGRGTFVSAQLPERRSHVLPTRWLDLVAGLETLKPEMIGLPEDEDASSLRHVLAGQAKGRYARFRRVHSRNGEPYCLIDIHLRKDVFDEDRNSFLTKPVILVIAQQFLPLVSVVRQSVTFSIADEITAHALGIALGAPVVEILRTVADADGAVVTHSYARYPGEFVRLDFDFAVAGPEFARRARGRKMKRLVDFSWRLLPFACAILVWYAMRWSGLVPPALLPPPHAVFADLFERIYYGGFLSDIWDSVRRVLLGLLFGMLVADPRRIPDRLEPVHPPLL